MHEVGRNIFSDSPCSGDRGRVFGLLEKEISSSLDVFHEAFQRSPAASNRDVLGGDALQKEGGGTTMAEAMELVLASEAQVGSGSVEGITEFSNRSREEGFVRGDQREDGSENFGQVTTANLNPLVWSCLGGRNDGAKSLVVPTKTGVLGVGNVGWHDLCEVNRAQHAIKAEEDTEGIQRLAAAKEIDSDKTSEVPREGWVALLRGVSFLPSTEAGICDREGVTELRSKQLQATHGGNGGGTGSMGLVQSGDVSRQSRIKFRSSTNRELGLSAEGVKLFDSTEILLACLRGNS